tara:strand:+ start:58292 stop:59512 length:1221 start_codon:yes stop_codon:yes gene_type:complete
MKHLAIFIDNNSSKTLFLEEFFSGSIPQPLQFLTGKRGALFAKSELLKMISEEERHDRRLLAENLSQPIRSLSSGEQKKALLTHVLRDNPYYLVLDSPFDNLDIQSQNDLKERLETVARSTSLVLLINRREDLPSFITEKYRLDGKFLSPQPTDERPKAPGRSLPLPPPPKVLQYTDPVLVEFRNVSVSFDQRPILKNINWTIRPESFWQLIGRNGSGKTTLLSMITGDNSKGYGQDLYIFGKRKGSGESVWDIKKNIGYFTPSMTDLFPGHHTTEHMLISGLHDSVGLYVLPTETEQLLAKEWLLYIGLWNKKEVYFHDLTMGEQRLIMLVRAMIKHPWLLILDEPTAGLDDQSATLFVELVNQISKQSRTAILYVSHRYEVGLIPTDIFELRKGDQGATGIINP